ncbi:hypothetical protein Tco_1115963, partial [Tanacetum coccineum]
MEKDVEVILLHHLKKIVDSRTLKDLEIKQLKADNARLEAMLKVKNDIVKELEADVAANTGGDSPNDIII